MAERERETTAVVRRGIPWWVWLIVAALIAILLIALLWPLLTGNNRAGTAATPSPSPVGSPAAPGTPVADLLIIVDAPEPTDLVGRRVELTGVEVQSVVGDTTFWVGPSADQQVLVVLEEDESAGPVEGQVDVEAGQTVSITGIVRELPSVDDAKQRWQLSDDAAAELEGEEVFVRAQRVEVEE